MSKTLDYYYYWGKASKQDNHFFNYHLLPYHCLDVAAVGNQFIAQNPHIQKRLEEILPWKSNYTLNLVTFFLSIHDLGKFSESFQKLIPEIWEKLSGEDTRKQYNLRHDSLGFLLWNSEIWHNIIKSGFDSLWGGNEDESTWQYLLQPCTSAVFGHHGRPPDILKISSSDPATLYSDIDRDVACSFVKECQNLFFRNESPFLDHDLDLIESVLNRFSWILSGITVISDWIGSDSSFFIYKRETIPLEEYWLSYALPSAQKALRNSGIGTFRISQKTGIRSLFPRFKDVDVSGEVNCLKPSPLQEFVSTCTLGKGPHLFVIEESTGGGKTEAAVTLAHRIMAAGDAEGMYVALPTMATANAMYERMKECYLRLYEKGNRPSLVLSHGSRHLSASYRETIGPIYPSGFGEYAPGEEDAGVKCAEWLSDHRKASLLASIGVGTIDQALVGIIPASHQSLRLLGLLRKVLIVDEVHAYDPYMNRLLRTLLAFQGAFGGSVILLSATLPRIQRDSYINSFAEGAGFKSPVISQEGYPLITHLSSTDYQETGVSTRAGTSRSVSVQFFYSEESVIKKIQEVINSGGCACWIRNTVSDALSAYKLFLTVYPAEQVSLFHARYAMSDRIEIENRVVEQFGVSSGSEERSGKLLIATQVVEQSLDIDFDYLVTDLAPIDLIIQRAGRLHRHLREGRGEPILGIYSPQMCDNPDDTWYSSIFQGGSYVYPSHGELWLTLKILQEKGCIKTPEDSRLLIEWVYNKDSHKSVPEGLRKRDDKARQEEIKAQGKAMMNSLSLNEGYYSSGERWDDDERVKTRYGELSVILRLGIIDNNRKKISPLCEGGLNPWEMSSVSVRHSLVPDDPVYDEVIADLVQSTLATLPDKGKRSILIPFIKLSDGTFFTKISGKNSQPIDFRYSCDTGLIITKGKMTNLKVEES